MSKVLRFAVSAPEKGQKIQKTPTEKEGVYTKPDLFSDLFNVAASRSAQITTNSKVKI